MSVAQFPQLAAPVFGAAAYVREPPLAREIRALDGARYVSYLPAVLPSVGYYFLITPQWWGLLANWGHVVAYAATASPRVAGGESGLTTDDVRGGDS